MPHHTTNFVTIETNASHETSQSLSPAIRFTHPPLVEFVVVLALCVIDSVQDVEYPIVL